MRAARRCWNGGTAAMLQLQPDPGKVAPNFDRTGRTSMRNLPMMAIAALLAGCSLFSTTQSW
ncbi:MAG: hypothetical protein ACREEP_17000, partial [Dongiaceae bacterium]